MKFIVFSTNVAHFSWKVAMKVALFCCSSCVKTCELISLNVFFFYLKIDDSMQLFNVSFVTSIRWSKRCVYVCACVCFDKSDLANSIHICIERCAWESETDVSMRTRKTLHINKSLILFNERISKNMRTEKKRTPGGKSLLLLLLLLFVSYSTDSWCVRSSLALNSAFY